MALVMSKKRLQGETTCSVCLDFFTAPVTLSCGHNFCRGCLDRCWDHAPRAAAAAAAAPCPQCRQRVRRGSPAKPNWQLANLAGMVKEASRPGGGGLCPRNRAPPGLFSQEDGVPLCAACRRSPEHRDHQGVPVEGAAREHQEKFLCILKDLMEKREKISVLEEDTQNESKELLQQTDTARQRAVAQLEHLHQFLGKFERFLLGQMEEVEKEIASRRDEKLDKLSKERASVENIIWDLLEKSQKAEIKCLQDVRNISQRCEKSEFATGAVTFPVELKWRNWDFFDLNPFLERVITQFKETVISGLHLQKANVTLDPDTANPHLILSEDLKSVHAGEKSQDLPHNPERFDTLPFVLGCEAFTAGRQFWEVSVGSVGNWSVGVARKSVRRKGDNDGVPEEGIWDVGKWGRMYCSANSFLNPLSRGAEIKRIRVSLNCTGEQLTFYDADTAALLCVYLAVPFSGDTLLPYFSVTEKAHLTVCP